MKSMAKTPSILGVFQYADHLQNAIHAAQLEKINILDVFSPVHLHEITETLKTARSPVRYFTFIGALTGFACGFLLAISSSLVWNLIVSGKPVVSIIPFFVIAFELTILFGAGATLVALLIFGKLPFFKYPAPAYRPEFSVDQFGLWLECEELIQDRIESLLKAHGAIRVELISGVNAKGTHS